MRYLRTQKDHGYRDSTNPLRGLNMSRLVGLQESGERGEYADLQWFYYYMERSDAMILSVIQRRRRSFSGAFRERCGSRLRLLFQSGLYEVNLMSIFFTTRFARANFGGGQRPEAEPKVLSVYPKEMTAGNGSFSQ